MLRDDPQGADLLMQARLVMSEHIISELKSETRYKALMILRAMVLAENELRYDDELECKLIARLKNLVAFEGSTKECLGVLSKGIREGNFDASAKTYELLCLITAYKLKETDASKISVELENDLEQL